MSSSNVSKTSDEALSFLGPQKPPMQHIIETCIFTIVDVVTFCGNLLVCVAIYKKTNLRTITNYHILSLALTDLLMSVFGMPFAIKQSLTQRLEYDECQFNGYVTYYLISISLHSMALIGVNRYITVVKPGLHPIIYKRKTTFTLCFVVWMIPLAILGIAYGPLEVRASPAGGTMFCALSIRTREAIVFYLVVLAVYVLLPIIIIPLCYFQVYRKLAQHNNMVAPSLQAGSFQGVGNRVEEAKITKTLTIILVGFLICWIPPVTVALCKLFDSNKNLLAQLDALFCALPLFVSSMINPFIYGVRNRAFRKAFQEIVCLK